VRKWCRCGYPAGDAAGRSIRSRRRADSGSVGRTRSIARAIRNAITATPAPRIASSQKWLPVATIEKMISAG